MLATRPHIEYQRLSLKYLRTIYRNCSDVSSRKVSLMTVATGSGKSAAASKRGFQISLPLILRPSPYANR